MEYFNLKLLNGESLTIRCETYEYPNTWGHRAIIENIGSDYIFFKRTQTYYNRTYESFQYETVLYKVINAYFKGEAQSLDRLYLIEQLKAIRESNRKESEAWLASMMKIYNSLSNETKENLKNSNVVIHSKEDAENLLNTAMLVSAMQNASKA